MAKPPPPRWPQWGPNGRRPVRPQTPRPQQTPPPLRPAPGRPQQTARPQRPKTPISVRPQPGIPERPQTGLPVSPKPGFPERPQTAPQTARPSQNGGQPERPPQIGLPPRPQIPPKQAVKPSQTPNIPSYPNFGQKLPGFAGAETLESKDTNDLRDRDYTPIDTPSRGPSTSRQPPKPTRPSNRYEINGANRIPYQGNNPKPNTNSEVDPRPVIPDTGNPIIGTKYGVVAEQSGIVRDVTITNERGQYQVIQTRYNQGQPIDPSFYGDNDIKPTPTRAPYIDKTVAVGLAVGGIEAGASEAGNQNGLVRGSIEDDLSTTTSTFIDYQGWYTEGDTIAPPKPSTSTSRNYADLNIQEKVVHTIGDWTTPRDEIGITFPTKSPPVLNTNGPREWTVNIENVPGGNFGEVRPSRPAYGNRVTDQYDPRGNNNWNTLGSRRPPLDAENNQFGRPNISPASPRPQRPLQAVSSDPENGVDNIDQQGIPDTSLIGTTNPNKQRQPQRPTRPTAPTFGSRPPFNRQPTSPVGEDITFLPPQDNGRLQPGL